ncbi:hypothetical protein EDD21DRAFT_439862 [Dissophora ornata]|nr:hypothetical protein EDD21DRAFT_439862 [Dissophora ornata]
MTLEEFVETTAYTNESEAGVIARSGEGEGWQPNNSLEKRVLELVDLVREQACLLTLKVTWAAFPRAFANTFAQQLYLLPNRLVALHLSKWRIQVEDLNMMVQNSPFLEELTARGLVVEPTVSPLTTSPSSSTSQSPFSGVPSSASGQPLNGHDHCAILNFGQVRRLSFHRLVFSAPSLLIECPAAQSIQLSGYGNQFASFRNRLVKRGESWSCPRLASLQYTGQANEFDARNEYSERSALSDILRTSLSSTSPSLVPPRLAQSNGGLTVQQQQGLRKIALTCCLELARVAVDFGLEPKAYMKLRRFQGSEDYLWGSDVEELMLGSWKCLGLESLQARFGLTPTKEVTQNRLGRRLHVPVTETEQRQVNAMYSELAELKHLKVLDLSGYGSMDNFSRGIPLTLERGLDNLSGLSNLETIHVTGWEAEMGAPEADWMARHWPRLENIYTLYNKNDNEWKWFLGYLREAQERVRSGHKGAL